MKQIRNIVIVWMLTGFWHGASWNFVLWGVYYGALLILEKVFLLDKLKKMPNVIRHVYTIFLVIIGWVLFSFDSYKEGITYISRMFGASGLPFMNRTFYYLLTNNLILLIFLVIGSTNYPAKFFKIVRKKEGIFSGVLGLSFLAGIFFLSLAYLVAATFNPFLYFRF